MGLLNFSSTESNAQQTSTFQTDNVSAVGSSLTGRPPKSEGTKLNFLTIQISDGQCYFADGDLHGEMFKKGTTIVVEPHSGHCEVSNKGYSQGEWSLHRTIAKGHPAIICTFFNKRTQMMEQRYIKIFFKDGLYRCGPRFPKKVRPSPHE